MSAATTSDAAAADHGNKTEEAPAESSSLEANRLREELQHCQEKFASWKEKAKIGVDNLRMQIIGLNQRLERSEQKRVEELRTVDLLQSSMSAQADLASAHSFAAACLFVNSLSARNGATEGAAKATASSSPSPTPAAAVTPPSPPSPPNALITKLQRTIQEQSDRLKETHHALKRSTNEVQQRIEALKRQDGIVAVLKRRLEASEAANVSLEEQLMNVPNVEEWRAAQDELDHQLERSRLEYETRESNLVLHHSNEIQALNMAHEQEIRELQRDAQEKVSQAVQNALASQAQAAASASTQLAQSHQQRQREAEDAAYMDLLSDYKALEATSGAAVRERDAVLKQQKTLIRELHDFFRAVGMGGIASASQVQSPQSGNVAVAREMTVEDTIRQIGEQRARVIALQEELSRCRREVVQLKRSKPSQPPDGLGAQQTQYVRSVVVQLLCSLNDASIAKRLLPVLSMLLKFSNDDMTAVTKAMPQWTQHR
ncbi:hypothetical protein ABB37_03581 [Leptomonas pyrrhocoris]|uniref:GRIP domain-containing protein n=1 Tax=Leptomonas pyrrhocoris TaxID=157538 RepID=A0A0M9G587_LEPPY|nr:hypothetical protein ABB37_03581 [Leptomonas pyrrhocoris]XP_015660982.1 hypothetical protein ABB37_03581 [Leptomonas pyrrhocoris]KPA82542.1 hypothetical protein ABB37_03581 [Leptomonas pyrrhocoris]KPA82543.1 hypothetical protein ABB37_03581 [Leptomonas pyrrhocoris]|eukprot:XP_015660981.1 hypothetical protein ABB37_03581 [Leptomonas pyrrhocoris]